MSHNSPPPFAAPAANIADLRRDYRLASLDEQNLPDDPMALFDHWFRQARAAELPEPNAMTLATVNAQGRPSARIVLLKGFDDQGFTFFTNYQSRKGQDLAAHPQACLIFLWLELERQVRIDGPVTKVSDEESDAYFNTRPLASRHGAWASPQSQVIASRQVLTDNEARVSTELGDQPPRPPHWGGYRVHPEQIEFWQGRSSRLHDRFLYQRSGAQAWRHDRLAP